MKKWIFVTFLLLVVPYLPAQAWQPPIGIPNPGFGITEQRPVRPNPWLFEVSGYYYVNGQIGTDTGRAYGTPAAPRRTIPRPVPAGSYVEVHDTYNIGVGGAIWLVGQGTAGSWVANVSGPAWIVGESSVLKPTFTTYEVQIDGSYLYLDQLDFHAVHLAIGHSLYDTHHILIRNCDIAGDGIARMNGIGITGIASDRWTEHVVIASNTIHHFGDMNPMLDTDVCGIVTGVYVRHLWLLDNTIHTISEGGFRVGSQNGPPQLVHHVYAGRNTIFNTNHYGPFVKWGEDIVFSQNDVSEVRAPPGSEYEGQTSCIGGQYGPRRFWMIYNRLHDSDGGGIGIASTDDVNLPIYTIGNIIYNIQNPGADFGSQYISAGILIRGGTERYIVNNTFHNVDAGIYSSPSAASFLIANNILSLSDAGGRHFNVDNSNIAQFVARNNLFYRQGSPIQITFNGNSYATAAAFNASGRGVGNLEGDPLFQNPAASDFKIILSSPAVDAGTVESVYQTFQDLYGLDIRRDVDGQVRPQGSAWDIGAFEYTVTEPFLQVISPNGGETWRRGETRTITWNATNITGDLVIELLQNAAVVGTIASSVDAAIGTYTWTVGRLQNGNFITGANLKIRIRTETGQVIHEIAIRQ